MPLDPEILRRMRENDPTLTKLWLQNTIGPEAFATFTELLSYNTTLTFLVLGKNQLSHKSIKAFTKKLEHNTTLTWFFFTNNKIDSADTKAFAEMLQNNTTLITLGLNSNQIDSESVIVLAKALEHNTTLGELILNYNLIGPKGAETLAEMLKYNKTLTYLWLENNQIGSEGAKALAKALEQNTTLLYLELWDNNISAEGEIYLQQIKTYLKRNRDLKKYKKTQPPSANPTPQLHLRSEKPKAAAITAALPTKKTQPQPVAQPVADTIPPKVTSQTQPSREVKLYQDAQALWDQNKFHDVVPICNNLLKANSNNVKVYLLRAHAYEKLRQLDAGIVDCEKILTPTQTASYSERLEAEQIKERLSRLKQLLNTVEIIANTAISLAIYGDAATFRPLRANLQNIPFDLQKPLAQLIMKCLIASKVITDAFTMEQQQAITLQLAIKLQAELLVFQPASKGVFWSSPAKIGLYHHDREITAKDVQTALTNPNNMIRKLFNGAIVRGNIAATTPSLYPVLSNSDSLTPSAPPISHFPSGTVTPSAPPFSNFPSGAPTPSAPFLTPANSVPSSTIATPLPSRPPTPPLQRKNRDDINEYALRTAVNEYLSNVSEGPQHKK